MRIVKNAGDQRVIDELRTSLTPQSSLDIASPEFSLFAFSELRELLASLSRVRLALPAENHSGLGLLGSPADRSFRNRLQNAWLALNEAGKVVLDDTVVACELPPNETAPDFLSSLKLNGQPRNGMFALYQGWINCLGLSWPPG